MAAGDSPTVELRRLRAATCEPVDADFCERGRRRGRGRGRRLARARGAGADAGAGAEGAGADAGARLRGRRRRRGRLARTWAARFRLRENRRDREAEGAASLGRRVRGREGEGALDPAAALTQMNAQRRAPVVRVTPDELRHGVRPRRSFGGERVGIRRHRRGFAHLRHGAGERVMRPLRHRGRGRARGFTDRDEDDQRNRIGHRAESLLHGRARSQMRPAAIVLPEHPARWGRLLPRAGQRSPPSAHLAAPSPGGTSPGEGAGPRDCPGPFEFVEVHQRWHHEPVMRALRVPAVTGIVISGGSSRAASIEGLLVADGGVDGTQRSGDEAASAADDAARSSRKRPATTRAHRGMPRRSRRGRPPTRLSRASDATRTEDVAVDAPFTCSGCAAMMCPNQLAACGQGSQCLAYRDCDEDCTGTSSAACTKSCESMYSAGEVAFAAFTICDLNCGAGCVAGLAVGVP